MQKYPKIQSIYKRDPETKKFQYGAYSTPEFEYLAHNEWMFMEKVDGTNIRVGWGWEEDKVLIGGKTDKAQTPAHLLTRLQELFTTEKMDRVFPDTLRTGATVVLYGEGYGNKIQKGGDYLIHSPLDVDFILFDVRVGNWWLTRDSVAEIAGELGIERVPAVDFGTLAAAEDLVEVGFKSLLPCSDREAEGLVLRPIVELLARNNRRIVTKVKTCDFR